LAGSDHLVDADGARALAAAAPKALLECHEYAELYHEIFNEAEPARGEVISDLSAWLEARTD
jgi:alpha-beta hydrolase superfamily lysophospholipase